MCENPSKRCGQYIYKLTERSKYTVCPHCVCVCVCVYCNYEQHWPVGFRKGVALCLLWGTNWNVKVTWMNLHCVYCDLKCKIHHRTSHEGPGREQRYSATISLISVLDEDGWLTPRPGSFTPRNNPISAGWAPGPVCTGAEKLSPTGLRSPDHPAGYILANFAVKYELRRKSNLDGITLFTVR